MAKHIGLITNILYHLDIDINNEKFNKLHRKNPSVNRRKQ